MYLLATGQPQPKGTKNMTQQLFGYTVTPSELPANLPGELAMACEYYMPHEHPTVVFEFTGHPTWAPEGQLTLNNWFDGEAWQLTRYPGHVIIAELTSNKQWLVCSELSVIR